MEYFEFHVKIDAQGAHVQREEGLDPIDGDIDYGNNPLRRRTLDMFKRWLESQQFRPPARDDLALVGTYLYKVLFSGRHVHEAFRTAFLNVEKRSNAGQDVALRVVLEFADDELSVRLAALPWEYLYFPPAAEGGFGKGFFVACQSPLILSRHVPANAAIASGPREEQLRILVLVSEPDYEMIDAGEGGKKKRARPLTKVESAKVISALTDLQKAMPERVKLEVESTNVSKEKFAALLRKVRPHVVHFIGHGKFEDKTGYLAFVRKERSLEAIEEMARGREVAWVDEATFADYFLSYRPRLIFLQACEGARSDSYQAFSGVAMTLVQQAVRAVIAMRYPVSNDMAQTFATTFYAHLAAGCDIDQAVQLGREQLATGMDEEKNFTSPDFGSPVAFFQGRDDRKNGDRSSGVDAILSCELKQPAPQLSPSPATSQFVACPYPDCQKPVNPGRRYCANCKRPIAPCPACKQLMAELTGFCDACAWRREDGPPAAVSSAAAPAPRQKD